MISRDHDKRDMPWNPPGCIKKLPPPVIQPRIGNKVTGNQNKPGIRGSRISRTERTGAKRFDIAIQFLIESITVSSLGGVIGIFLGVTVSFLAAVIVQHFGYDWEFIISPISIIVAVLISVIVGVIFGMYPARKAADISPMEALRYE